MNEQNPYTSLLAGLEAKRDELTSAINVIRREMGLAAEDGSSVSALPTGGLVQTDTPTELRSDTFFGMKIPDAIRQYLMMVKRPQKAAVIARALTEGGLQYTSKNWLNTVQTTLVRMRPGVVRLPNGWGLAEWYPGRTFDKQAPSKPKATKKPASAHGGKVPPKAPGGDLDASRRLQGQYLGVLKKFSEEKRGLYKAIAKQDGREKAIKAMERDLGIK